MKQISLPQVIEHLGAFYGKPDPPDVNDPWEMIVWENVAYLVDDERRQKAMEALRRGIGISPERILAATTGSIAQERCHSRSGARTKCGEASS